MIFIINLGNGGRKSFKPGIQGGGCILDHFVSYFVSGLHGGDRNRFHSEMVLIIENIQVRVLNILLQKCLILVKLSIIMVIENKVATKSVVVYAKILMADWRTSCLE